MRTEHFQWNSVGESLIRLGEYNDIMTQIRNKMNTVEEICKRYEGNEQQAEEKTKRGFLFFFLNGDRYFYFDRKEKNLM